MKNLISNRKRLLQMTGIILVLLIVALYIGLPSVMAVAAVFPKGSSVGDPPDGFTETALTTSDGLQLGAWYSETQNGAVIILVHGASSGRESVRSYATMLRENGFGVLAINLRGFGDSEGRINRLGWNGTRDIGAAVDFLTERDDVESIGGLGLSMGGEVLLGATSEYPQIQSVVADGATFRSIDEYIALPANRPLYRNFTRRVFSFMVGILSGDDPPQPTLLQSVAAAETTSFLFIAAGKDGTEVTYNTFFHDTVPDRSSLWVIPDVGHTDGFSHYPADYEQRVVKFFMEVLQVP